MTIQFSERVRIKIEAFYLEQSSRHSYPCRYDYLEVRDGESSSSNIIGSKLCGCSHYDAIESTGSSMTLVFHTDSSGGRTGFKIVAELGKNRLSLKGIELLSANNSEYISFIWY